MVDYMKKFFERYLIKLGFIILEERSKNRKFLNIKI